MAEVNAANDAAFAKQRTRTAVVVHDVSVGNDLYGRLADAVSQAKGDRPLRLVTVIVPSRGAIRDVLQYLSRHGGVANVRVLTFDLAVDTLAALALAPRVPLPFPYLAASVQKVLADVPGVFIDVADQPITAEALAAASRTLSAIADPSPPDATPLVRDMLRVHTAATAAHTDTHYLPHEAYGAATSRIDEMGEVVVFPPTAADPGASQFLDALTTRGQLIESDAEPLGTMVVHASDADDEIRSITRLVRQHLAAGVLGHRIGVFYANGR